MAAYERVTLNRGGRNSRFDCTAVMLIQRYGNAMPDLVPFHSGQVRNFYLFVL